MALNTTAIAAAIDELAASGIQSVAIAGQNTQAIPIRDLIEALRFAAEQDAVAADRPGLGLRFQEIKPAYHK